MRGLAAALGAARREGWVCVRAARQARARGGVARCFGTAANKSGGGGKAAGGGHGVFSHWNKEFEMPKAWTLGWWAEYTRIVTVFSVAGISTMLVTKELQRRDLWPQGSFKEGPNSFRAFTLVGMMPIHSSLLFITANVFGRRPYFIKVIRHIWSPFTRLGRLLGLVK